MTTESNQPSSASPPTRPPASSARKPADWPGDVLYRTWKMVLVVTLVLLVGTAGVFGIGLLIGRLSGGDKAAATTAPASGGREIRTWSCSMHPSVNLPGPGQCPICFMDLIPIYADGGDDIAPDAPMLRLSPRARMLARVETAPVESTALTHTVEMVGKVAVDETRITYISSYIPGRLDRLFVNYTGIFVRKGDHLAEIYSPDLLVAQTEYITALETLERTRAGVADDNPVMRSAQVMVDSGRRKLELWGIAADQIEHLRKTRAPSDHMRIDAPVGGWVIDRQGYEGMYVETGTRLFTIADLTGLWVLLDAYELDLSFIHYGQEVRFDTEAYPGQAFTGKVAYIDPVLQESTRTVKIRLNVDNPELKLRPGMFVRASLQVHLGEGGQVVDNALAGKWICPMHPEIVKDTAGKCDLCGMDLVKAEDMGFASKDTPVARVLAIPQTAVLLTGKRAVVYVEQPDGDGRTYEGREIKLGPRAGDFYVVLSGLRAGERVVTRGALQIDSAMQIQGKPSMMRPEGLIGEDEHEEHAHEAPASAPASMAMAGAGYHQHMAPVIEAYLHMADALAADDADKAALAMDDMRERMQGASPHGLSGAAAERFGELTGDLAAAIPEATPKEIEAIRAALPRITTALETYLRTFGHQRAEPLLRMHCPMAFGDKGADWFQASPVVNNAYFGSGMLRCGGVTAKIDGSGAEVR